MKKRIVFLMFFTVCFYVLAARVMALGVGGEPPGLSAIVPGGDTDTDTDTDTGPVSYGDYLVIKYLLYLHDYEKAEALIDKYLEKYPDDPFMLAEKAWLFHKVRNNPQKAMELLKKSRAVFPTYYYSNYLLASVLFYQYTSMDKDDREAGKKAAEAVKYLEISTADNPEFYDALFLQGIILGEQGKYAESNRAFERANRLEETAGAYDYMAYNYKRLKNTAAEISSYRKILEISPFDYKALQALAKIYLEEKDFENASHYLEKLLARDPSDQKVSVEYLYSLFAAGETEKFMELTGTMDVSASALLTNARALILTQKGKFTEAEELLKKTKNKDTHTDALLAGVYLKKHDYYQAYQVIEKIENPGENPMYYSVLFNTLALMDMNQRIVNLFNRLRDNKNILANLAEEDYYSVLFAYAHLGQPGKVREVAHFAAAQLNEQPGSLTELDRLLGDFSPGKKIHAVVPGKNAGFDLNLFLILAIYKNQRQYANAISLLEEICRDAQDPDPYLELCDIYREQGHPEKVERLLKKLAKRFPGFASVKNFHAYFLALQGKNLDHALQLSAEALAGDQENPAFLDTYGYILLRLGRLSEAVEYLEKAYRRHPFEKEIMEHLADCYRLKNEKDRVVEIYQKAIDSGVDFKDRLLDKIRELKNKRLPGSTAYFFNREEHLQCGNKREGT
jgi:tetratricopeptide (TPR) repeat protein